jgi:hypothetical protein
MLGVFAEDFRLLHATLPEGPFRICFNPRLIAQVPGPVVLAKNISCMHGDEQPFRNGLTYNLRLSNRPSVGRRGPKAPEVSIITSAANDGAAIPRDGHRTADHRRSRRLRNSSVATSIVPKRCKRTVPGRRSRLGSRGEVRLALLTRHQT